MKAEKRLVVFYSLEGNTKMVAQAIAKAVEGDLLELKPLKDVASSGFMRYVWGGKQVLFKEKPPLQPLDINPQEYDLIFLGTPVWAGSYAPAIRSFLEQFSISGKRIALFSCYGGQAGKTYDNIKKEIPDNQFVGEIGFKEPRSNDKQSQLERACQWAGELMK